jgi:hypothetical protein
MKKLIFLLSLVTVLLASYQPLSAQEKTTYDNAMGYGDYRHEWKNESAVNTFKVGDSTWTYTIFKNTAKPLKYDLFMKLDSTGGTSNVITFKLQGKKFIDSPTWTDLKTFYWTSGKDTTKTISEATTAQAYQLYKLSATGANDTFLAKILLYAIKFWE